MIKEKSHYLQKFVIGTKTPISILKQPSSINTTSDKLSRQNKKVQFDSENQEHIYNDTYSKISINNQIPKRLTLNPISVNSHSINLRNSKIKSR